MPADFVDGFRHHDGVTLYDDLLELVPTELHAESGEVFYSGRTSFEQAASPLYVLGFNPGGQPAVLGDYTIGANVRASQHVRDDWSAYVDEAWGTFGPGASVFQRRILHMYEQCGLNPRLVPASNVIFVRSARVATLDARRTEALLNSCWTVHQGVIESLSVRVVVCLGQDAGVWVRRQVGADVAPAIETYVEDNRRGWRSTTHVGRDGLQVVTLTHPSVADWTRLETDPTSLVVRALARDAGTLPCAVSESTSAVHAAENHAMKPKALPTSVVGRASHEVVDLHTALHRSDRWGPADRDTIKSAFEAAEVVTYSIDPRQPRYAAGWGADGRLMVEVGGQTIYFGHVTEADIPRLPAGTRVNRPTNTDIVLKLAGGRYGGPQARNPQTSFGQCAGCSMALPATGACDECD